MAARKRVCTGCERVIAPDEAHECRVLVSAPEGKGSVGRPEASYGRRSWYVCEECADRCRAYFAVKGPELIQEAAKFTEEPQPAG